MVSLLNSNVFKDFPTLKILVSHGGGAIPYHWARFEASSLRQPGATRFSERMRNLYYDTVIYSSDSLALLIKTVGADRCLFGTERPGVGTVKDPRTGKWMDETRYLIEAFDWLSDSDKKLIFEGNAKKLFKLEGVARGMIRPLFFAVLAALPLLAQQAITVNYPAKAPANWPLFLAKEGGYYQKYGLDAKLVFAVHPAGMAMLVSGEAQMTNYPMDQAMQAAMRDSSLVIMGSPLNRGFVCDDDARGYQEYPRAEGQTIRRESAGRSALQFCAGDSGEVRDRGAGCASGSRWGRMETDASRRW